MDMLITLVTLMQSLWSDYKQNLMKSLINEVSVSYTFIPILPVCTQLISLQNKTTDHADSK